MTIKDNSREYTAAMLLTELQRRAEHSEQLLHEAETDLKCGRRLPGGGGIAWYRRDASQTGLAYDHASAAYNDFIHEAYDHDHARQLNHFDDSWVPF